jgi:hypothetical protein
MKVVRTGISRTVILVGRYAVKIPATRRGTGALGTRGRIWSFAHGILANLSEQEWSDTPGVCPVLYGFAGLVNVYPRCEPVTIQHEQVDYDAIGFLGECDRKPDNVGWLNGRMVWVDYDMSGRRSA